MSIGARIPQTKSVGQIMAAAIRFIRDSNLTQAAKPARGAAADNRRPQFWAPAVRVLRWPFPLGAIRRLRQLVQVMPSGALT